MAVSRRVLARALKVSGASLKIWKTVENVQVQTDKIKLAIFYLRANENIAISIIKLRYVKLHRKIKIQFDCLIDFHWIVLKVKLAALIDCFNLVLC